MMMVCSLIPRPLFFLYDVGGGKEGLVYALSKGAMNFELWIFQGFPNFYAGGDDKPSINFVRP